MLKSGIYDFVICRGGTDMCFVLGFGRKRPDMKQYRISGLTSNLTYNIDPFDSIKNRVSLGVSRDRQQGVAAAIARDNSGVYLGSLAFVAQGVVDTKCLEILSCREVQA